MRAQRQLHSACRACPLLLLLQRWLRRRQSSANEGTRSAQGRLLGPGFPAAAAAAAVPPPAPSPAPTAQPAPVPSAPITCPCTHACPCKLQGGGGGEAAWRHATGASITSITLLLLPIRLQLQICRLPAHGHIWYIPAGVHLNTPVSLPFLCAFAHWQCSVHAELLPEQVGHEAGVPPLGPSLAWAWAVLAAAGGAGAAQGPSAGAGEREVGVCLGGFGRRERSLQALLLAHCAA